MIGLRYCIEELESYVTIYRTIERDASNLQMRATSKKVRTPNTDLFASIA